MTNGSICPLDRFKLSSMLECFIPEAGNSIKLGNVTFDNDPIFGIGHDIPHAQWDKELVVKDLQVLIMDNQDKWMNFFQLKEVARISNSN